jgi:ketosteroid isomerase-like protein
MPTARGGVMGKPAWIDGLIASIDGMDADRFVSFLTGDAIFRYGSNPPVEGKGAVREAVAGVFSMFRALTHTLEGVWAHPDAVFVQGTVQYTMHDGSAVSLPFVDCFKMDGEKIREFLIYIDPTPLAG